MANPSKARGTRSETLAVRWLLEHGFQAAYDLLTGPWRSVIGPVHPDDPTPP